MARTGYKSFATDQSGNIVSGTAVELRNKSDNSLASLYDAAIGGSALTNPFNTSADGSFEFFVTSGRYDLLVGTGASQVTIPLEITGEVAKTITEATGEHFSSVLTVLELKGRDADGDCGCFSSFKRVDAEPTHTAKFRSVDRFLSDGTTDATNGGWWERIIDENGVAVPWYGATDTDANRRQTLSDAYDHWNTLSGTGYSDAGPTANAAKLYIPKIPGLTNYSLSSSFFINTVGANCVIEGAGALMWLDDITIVVEHDEVRVSNWFNNGSDTYDGIRVGSVNGRADRLLCENFFFNQNNYGIRIQDTAGAQFQNGFVMRSATDNMWMQSYDYSANPDASGNVSFNQVHFWVADRYNANIRGNGEIKMVDCELYDSGSYNLFIGGSSATGERVLQMYFTETTFTIGNDDLSDRSQTAITSITDNGSGDIRVNYAAGTMPYLFEGQRQVRIETTVYGNIQGTQHITNVTNSSFDMPGVSYISTDTGTVYHGGWSIYIDNVDAPSLDTTETYDLHFTGGTYNRAYIGRSHNVNFVGMAMGDQIYVDSGCKSFTRLGTSLGRYGDYSAGSGGSLDSTPISGPGKWTSISNYYSGTDFGAEISAPDDNASYTEAGSFGLPDVLNSVRATGAGVTVTGGKLNIASNEFTLENAPRFSASLSANASNVTGNGTSYTVIFDNELYDNGSDYNASTGVFTAPYTAVYRFNASVQLTGLSGATSVQARFLADGVNYINRVDGSDINDRENLSLSEEISLSSGDTVSLVVSVSGLGSDTADVLGGASPVLQSTFSGSVVG